MTESQTASDDPSPPTTGVVPATKRKPTTAERRAARQARELAQRMAVLEALDAERRAERQAGMEARNAEYARAVAGALELLEHLARMNTRRTAAA